MQSATGDHACSGEKASSARLQLPRVWRMAERRAVIDLMSPSELVMAKIIWARAILTRPARCGGKPGEARRRQGACRLCEFKTTSLRPSVAT